MWASVRRRRPWRMISWPAAKGMRWVKPSSATSEPSTTIASTASARVVSSAIGGSLSQGAANPPGSPAATGNVEALKHFDVLIVGGGFGGATAARHLQDLLAP